MKEISNEFLLQRRQWASFLTLTFLSQDSRLQSLSRSSLDSSSCPSHHFLRVSGSVSSSEADDQWEWFLSEDFIDDCKERDRHSSLQSTCTLWRLLPSLTPLIAGLDKVIGNYPQNENKSDPSCFIVLLIHSGERWLGAGRTLAQCSGHGESQWIREGLSPDNEATGNKLFWIRRNLIEVKLNIWTQETINIISIDCSQAAHRDMVVATLHSTELLWAGWQVFISASSKNVYGNETGARFT